MFRPRNWHEELAWPGHRGQTATGAGSFRLSLAPLSHAPLGAGSRHPTGRRRAVAQVPAETRARKLSRDGPRVAALRSMALRGKAPAGEFGHCGASTLHCAPGSSGKAKGRADLSADHLGGMRAWRGPAWTQPSGNAEYHPRLSPASGSQTEERARLRMEFSVLSKERE